MSLTVPSTVTMRFEGFTSLWIRPAPWTAASALAAWANQAAIVSRAGAPSGPRRITSSSVSPSIHSRARNVFTGAERENSFHHSSFARMGSLGGVHVSSPCPSTRTTFLWSNRERNAASCWKRARASSGRPSWRTLSATLRPVESWRPTWTVAKPPAPRGFPRSQSPRTTPWISSGASRARSRFTSRSRASAFPRSSWKARRTACVRSGAARVTPVGETYIAASSWPSPLKAHGEPSTARNQGSPSVAGSAIRHGSFPA